MPRRKTSLADRFWARVRPEVGEKCWEWSGYTSGGYGHLFGGRDGPRNLKAHRVSWEIHYGPIPAGLGVLHRCDNPRCVRPDHLFLGTPKDNSADRHAKGRDGSHKGRANGRCQLTEDEVRTIRSRLARGESSETIAPNYCVTSSAIRRIATRRTWAWLP